MLISDIDYNASTALTIAGQCPSVSHGLHSIRKGQDWCEQCGIKSCDWIQPGMFRIVGMEVVTDERAYVSEPVLIAAKDGTAAMLSFVTPPQDQTEQ